MWWINKEFRSMCTQIDFRASQKQIALDDWADRQVLDPKIWDTVLINTAAGEFRVAACYDELLTSMYGDYRKLPPLTERVNEFMRSYNRIMYFENNWPCKGDGRAESK
jgi:hypothetical protein